MKPPYEDLSRLLEGDLPEPDAQRLRSEIAADPEARAAWTGLQAAIDDLSSLPDVAAPADLDARVLGARPARSSRWFGRTPIAVAGLLAAAAALVLFVRAPAPDTRLSIAPDGVVTVAVARGTATLTGPSGVPLVVPAGASHTIGPVPATEGLISGVGTPAGSAVRMALLEAEVADLRRQLEAAEASGAFARGQLTAGQGPPSEWPSDVPEAYRPASFQKHLEESLSDLPGAEVYAFDCSEFPCIVTLRITDTRLGWEQRVEAFVHRLAETHYPQTDTWLAIAKSDDDGTIVGGAGVAFSPEDGLTEDVRTRTHYRAVSLLQEIEGVGGP